MIQQIERQFVRSTRPLYGHLVTLFESAIARGELPSGSRLPPERELASRLQISRTTVCRLAPGVRARVLLYHALANVYDEIRRDAPEMRLSPKAIHRRPLHVRRGNQPSVAAIQ